MGEFDLESLVLEVIRGHTGRQAAGSRSRFDQDLGLSENGRNALFAFLVEAFSARGVNLPSRRFYLSDFMKCATPGEVQEAIREALSGVKRKPEPAPTAPATQPAPAPASAEAPSEAAIAASSGKSATRGAKSGGTSKPKSKAPVKKKAPAKTKAPPRK
jgi:hypothetical protein